jgi:hypothetical protein
VGILKRFMMAVAATGAAGVAATVGITASAGWQATPAEAATTSVQLPISTYSHMLIDPAHQHIFFTGGSGSASILVTDYSGNAVATIPNEPGATGLALSGDGSTVYAALANGDAVSAISTSTLTETTRYATGAGTQPTYVAYTSGKIWFGYGGAAQGGIGSIDPSTGAVTLNATNDPINSWYAAPILAASPDGELAAGEPGQSPVQLATYDVSSGTATVLAPELFDQSADNLQSMQITPDGNDLVTASASPEYQQVYKVSDLSSDGEYPTTAYPNSVSISGDGSVAAGTYSGSNEVFVFAPGGSTPLNTYDFGSNWLAKDGVALTPDGSELFAITSADVSGDNPTLNIIPGPEQAPSTLSLTGPATVMRGQTITLSGTLGGPSSDVGGQALTVTRFDPAHPDGVTLPGVTTAADGSFSFTDTAPKARGQNTSTVTYQVSYAGDAHLSAATASASVTVQNDGS